MPIALGTAESSSNFFANQRDTYVHENAFVISDVHDVEARATYNFNNMEEGRTAFFVFIVLKTDIPKDFIFNTQFENTFKTCIPNTLYAPFNMKVFESLTDMEDHSIINASDTNVTIAVIQVPVMSLVLHDMTSSVYIDTYAEMLILYDTPLPGEVNFEDSVLTVSKEIQVIFTKATYVSQLRVSCTRHNNVRFLSNKHKPIKQKKIATYVDNHIVLEFLDTGVHMISYIIKISKAAQSALLLHRISSDLSGQLVLQDEDENRAVDAIVKRVFTDSPGSQIESYFVNQGMIHFTASDPDLQIQIELEAQTGFDIITVQLKMGVIKMKGSVFEYVDFLHKDTNETYRVQIKEAPNLQVFKLGEEEEVFAPQTKINLSGITLTSDGNDLLVDGDAILNSKILQDPLETETAIQIARTRLVFTERNRIRVDQKSNGQWNKGDYVYKNNLVELPLRFGFVDEVYASVSKGDLQIDGVGGISVAGKC